jgi:glutamine synthetase
MLSDQETILNPNELVKHLKKPAVEFTRTDIVRFVQDMGIKMLNFRYIAEDGKLKTLNFVITSLGHLNDILTTGERVDGSSLFSYVEAGHSDLYVVPRYRTAFVNPFSTIPTLEVLCSFYNANGTPYEGAPEYVLRKAHETFKKKTGFTFKALGEIEYYVNYKSADLYPLRNQGGYHQSKPFSKFEELRVEALDLLAKAGCKIKYGHSEVGSFSSGGEDFEQHEIEFLPVDVEDAADQMVLAKWILRMLSYKYGVELSFAPKISVGKAGSGMHVHILVERDNRNALVHEGELSDTAYKIMAGILDLSPALTAFGNTIPTSYLRLVPHQEAPTSICWGDRNRSALIRVPLGWRGGAKMIVDANPAEDQEPPLGDSRQTIEFRAPDGSADVYKLLAGLVIASMHGLHMPDALKKAEDLYVDVNIFKNQEALEKKGLNHLPASCYESAQALENLRTYFEKDGLFPPGVIDQLVKQLKSYNDKGLSERLEGQSDEIRKLVREFIHIM